MVRDVGAKKVFFASAAPKLISPCLYGIDIPTRQELIAHSLNTEEIRKSIGADYLFYQDLKDSIKATWKIETGEFTIVSADPVNTDPAVNWIRVRSPSERLDPGGEVSQGSSVRIITGVTDIETETAELAVTISYLPPGGAWTEVTASHNPNQDNWYGIWAIPDDAVLGLYDVMVNVTDLDGGSSWMIDMGEFHVTV